MSSTAPTSTTNAAAMTEANRLVFDEMAIRMYRSPINRASMATLSNALLDRLSWIGVEWRNHQSINDNESKEPSRKLRLLDYACGTGALILTLAPYVDSAYGIDVSPGMLASLSEQAAARSDIPSGRVKTVIGDLIGVEEGASVGELDGEEWWGFDVVSVGMALHHFDDPGNAVQRLVKRLKPGGVLIATELVVGGGEGHDHGGHDHGHGHGHGHAHGHFMQEFSDVLESVKSSGGKDGEMAQNLQKAVKGHEFPEVEVKKMFEAAGLVDVETDQMKEDFKFEFGEPPRLMTRKAFFAKGRKSA
jgi:SAM-dependent methyltransferase